MSDNYDVIFDAKTMMLYFRNTESKARIETGLYFEFLIHQLMIQLMKLMSRSKLKSEIKTVDRFPSNRGRKRQQFSLQKQEAAKNLPKRKRSRRSAKVFFLNSNERFLYIALQFVQSF